MPQERIRRALRKSEFEHTKSLLNVAGSQAMTWMIGFKRSANSILARANRESVTTTLKDEG